MPRDRRPSTGEYVAGWIGRGPVGVLGTNRADAEAVVQRVLADLPSLLRQRGVETVDGAGWSRIDAAEVARGQEHGRAYGLGETTTALQQMQTFQEIKSVIDPALGR